MSAIVPRWEWRTFGPELGAPERRFAELERLRVQESDEVYLLSLGSDASVKFRDDVMDVKRREAVDDRGLEQWRPIMKAAFPLSDADVSGVLEALGAGARTPARSVTTLDELVGELVEPSPELLAVRVHKRRERYAVAGCTAELTSVRAGEHSARTIAVEDEDPARVVAALRELGLGSRRNVSVARGLKTLVGFGSRPYAVIDVGTNSVKFHIGEVDAGGAWRTVADRAEVTRLGEGLSGAGLLGAEPVARTVEAIAGMSREAQEHGVLAIAAVGTAGLRIAPNSAALVDAVAQRTGIEVEVIPGDEEARLAYLAARAGLGVEQGSVVVFDTGGGSSQFTFGEGERVDERFSLEVGAARFTERFGLDGVVSPETLTAALEAIAEALARLDGRPVPDAVVGMGGAVTNLAAVRHGLATYDPDVVQGTVLDRAEIDRQIELYRTSTADERRHIVGLQPNRAEVILAGACIVRTILARLGRDSLTVSDRGLRHGLLVERFGR